MYNVSAVYLARHAGGELRLDPAEHDRHAYFNIARLPAPLNPPVIPVLRVAAERLS